MTWDRWAETLHVTLPTRLRRVSPLLGVTLADGVYLTAWPLWAVLAPVLIFAFGFSVGGWHWLPQNIWDYRITAWPAVAFMQMLPLLVVAVIAGAFSAGLGLLLVLGYAIGDLFISGATYAPYFHRVGMAWWLGHVTTAQLVTYLVFLLLAVLPAMVARLFTASVPGLRKSASPLKACLRALVTAAFAALLVYAWVMMAPMAVRPLWLWVNSSTSPVTVQYFNSVVNPTLPFVAAGCILVRALIEALANHVESATRNAARIAAAYAPQPGHAKGNNPSGWFGAITGAAVVTLLLLGMIIRVWPTGVLVFAGVLALFVTHRIVLPRWVGWRAWTLLMNRIPLAARWLVTLVGAYAIGRIVLAAPGMAVRLNPAAGAFGAELFAIVIGLALSLLLFPVQGRAGAHAAPNASGSLGGLLQVLFPLAAAALLMVHSEPASAYCLDPSCCFVYDGTAGLVIAGFLAAGTLVFLLLNPGFWLGFAVDMLGGWVAELASAIEMGAGLGEAVAAGAEGELTAFGAQLADDFAVGVFKEGAKEVLQEGLSNVEDSIHAATQGITDLAHGADPAPYPLGADGSGTAVQWPSAGGSGFDTSQATNLHLPQSPDPSLPANTDVPNAAQGGPQPGHASGFGDVRFGSPGEPGSHYVWVSDGHHISLTSAHSQGSGPDASTASTNPDAPAAGGGRIWFGQDGTVTMQPDTNDPERLQAIIRLWRSLGYAVRILPAGG